MTRKRIARPVRMLLLSAAIAAVLSGQAQAQSSLFARRGADPAAQIAQAAQRQGLQSAQAAQMAQKSLQAFQRAAQLRASLDAAQAAARAAAAASQVGNDIPNGLAPGGLQVAPNLQVDTGPIRSDDPRLGQDNIWLGAKAPTQSVADGRTTVTIEQTQKKAILNWETFNVGKQTTVRFDQSAGGGEAASWIALNRINDPSASPSRIFGNIEAQGQVYLLNRNGILFGGTGQVNTHSLLASSLNLFTEAFELSNRQFLQAGLTGGLPLSDILSTGIGSNRNPGDIRIEAGARIATGADGFSLIAAPNLSNAGTVSAQDGQAVLAAVNRVYKSQITHSSAPRPDSQLPVAYDLRGSTTGNVLQNTGIVESKRGDATLVGYDVRQHGWVGATTSISRAGSVHLLAVQTGPDGTGNTYTGGLLELGTGSATTILPERDGETTNSTAAADRSFVAPSATLLGAQVHLRSDSLVYMPGADLSLIGAVGKSHIPRAESPSERILVDDGATVSVAGLPDVQLEMDAHLVTIPRVGQNELADTPLLRDSPFYRQPMTIDARLSGTRADGSAWIGSPLINAAGYVEQVPRTIDQMLIDGGDIDVVGSGDIVVRHGATLDLDGGYLHYLGGTVETRRVLGADGRVYDLDQANPNLQYLGFAGEQSVDHARWGVQETYVNPLLGSRRYYESDYLHGGDAGTLRIQQATTTEAAAPGVLALDGRISAHAESGRRQLQTGELARGGTLALGGDSLFDAAFPDASISDIPRSWRIQEQRDGRSAGIGIDTGLETVPGSEAPAGDPENPFYWSTLSTELVEQAGFQSVRIDADQVRVEAGAELQVRDGGSIGIEARRIEIDGGLTARSGEIELNANSRVGLQGVPDSASLRNDIVLGHQARLDVSGLWINDDRRLADVPAGGAFVDGGRISLGTRQISAVDASGNGVDRSGSILLAEGAVLDASGGGRLLPDGSLAVGGDGVPLGRGGDISLQTYLRDQAPTPQRPDPFSTRFAPLDAGIGLLDFQNATLLADGFGGGGTLSLRAMGIRIGGEAPDDARVLHLHGGFFENRAFGAYDLSAELDATIVAGTRVTVSQRQFLPDLEALRQAPTGTRLFGDLDAAGRGRYGQLGRLDDYRRPAADFSLRAGDFVGRPTGEADPQPLHPATGTLLLDRGASLNLDAGGDVRLGSRGQLTVLGDITARGGSITLSGDTTDDSGLAPPPDEAHTTPHSDPTRSVWVGAEARLDVSGISLIDPLAARAQSEQGLQVPRTGRVLDGGSITLSNDSGYLIVEEGAQFELSGAQDHYQLPSGLTQLDGGGMLQWRPVWSHGGTLTLAASAGLYFDGSIAAAGGAAQARGGTLAVLPLAQGFNPFGPSYSARGIVVEQSGSRLPDGLRPGDVVEAGAAQPSGLLYLAADRLAGSGVDTVRLGNLTPGADGVPANSPLVPIAFAGDVSLQADRALQLNASEYRLLSAGADRLDALSEGSRVALEAAFVGFSGYRRHNSAAAAEPVAAHGDTRLEVRADHIDLGGQIVLSGVADATFDSSGDLRFHTPNDYAYRDAGNNAQTYRPGELASAGDLNFRAAQLYPASGETFLVRAVNPAQDTTIRILPGETVGALPLSAGGTLLFDADTIEQGGTVRAPGGSIVFGVGDPDDAATRALFGDRPLTRTDTVRLLPGSLTSVSLEGATLPFGMTVDGAQWRYDLLPAGSPELTAPPQKRIELAGDALELQDGARVDLSGGGELQAVEWVSGTGGSRDVLAQSNTRYEGGAPVEVPLYPDERGVYAIVPGLQSPVAATDPVFARDAAATEVGRAVYLSGVPGLPDGVYTLLPAKYATLPGAYRVVQRTGTRDSVAAHNTVAPDGTAIVAGHYVDALTGARDARSTTFEVQPRETWGLYSEYAFSRASQFFGARAQGRDEVAPLRPADAGQLVLAAARSLSLGARLDTAAAQGGSAAQIDIASQALQIRDGDHAARDGYVQLDVADLNALGAGSLLIGGRRTQTADGTRIDVLADRVTLDNDAADPLAAPEILLVAGAGDAPEDGLHIGAGAALRAQGELPAAAARPILIGEDGGASGDGALLRLSNAGEAPLLRDNVPAFAQAQGRLSVGAGARLDGGASLTLDSTGDTRVSAEALLRGDTVAASAGLVRVLGDGAQAADDAGLLLGATSLAGFADAERIGLRSYDRMEFLGDVALDIDRALTLSAGTFAGDGGDVLLRADTLTLSNELGAASADSVGGAGTLTLQGREVAFGEGDKTLAGFGRASVDAGEAVIGRGRGEFDFGDLDVELRAPVVLADAGADNTLRTGGAMRLRDNGGSASNASPLGGTLTLQAGSLDSDTAIRARAGTVNLVADRGDLQLRDGARVDVSGTAKAFYDVAAYAPGGQIALTAAQGTVRLDAGASLDFSAADAGGDAGRLTVAAPQRNAELLGRIDGDAPKGTGGAFSLDVGGSVDLDALARRLADSGIERAIAVRTRSGNLTLSAGSTLRAGEVELVADGGADAASRDPLDGNVIVDGLIDASGTRGGSIELWGRHGVAVNGRLDASGSAADQRGGEIVLGTSGRSDGSLNEEFGYQNVRADASGVIAIGERAVLDVSGGSAGGLSGGTVDLRAPLLADGEVNVDIARGARIDGAREVGLEAYAVWSTTDASTDPGKHFDGIIDPAGWYDAQGRFIGDGTWTDRHGNPLPAPSADQLADYLSRHFYTPGTVNEAHRRFYGYADEATGAPGTLMGFVQRPGFAFEDRFAHVANFRARPGIELRNPDPNVNGGRISVLTDWNLGSGASRDALDFRYSDTAPTLTLRAEDGVMMKASLSDGFYQVNNPFGRPGAGGPTSTFDQASQRYDRLIDQWIELGFDFSGLIPSPESLAGDEAALAQYYGQYELLLDMLTRPQPELNSDPSGTIGLLDGFLLFYALGIPPEPVSDAPTPPPPPTSPADYAGYLGAYERYALDLNSYFLNTGVLPELQPISLPVLGAALPGDPPPRYNTPSLQARLDNPLPLATMSLIGGDSSRYRIVAGADFAATAPSALRAGSQADIVLDGHRRYQQDGQRDVLVPNLVRTGTGSIELSAARDLRFADADAPASVYTAGRPAEGTAAGSEVEVRRSESGEATTAGVLVSATAYAEAAGDIVLRAGRDIVGNRQVYDRDGSLTGVAGNYVGQYWWPWLETANLVDPDTLEVLASPINFGGFAQGVMTAGGDVEAEAGRDIVELSVSAPTSYDPQGEYGGGNIDVGAGRDVLSSDFYLARGEGRLDAGGRLGSSFDLRYPGRQTGGSLREFDTAVDPVLALQDGQWSVQARGDAAIGAIVNPRYLVAGPSGLQGPSGTAPFRSRRDYSEDSSVSIAALDGDLRLNTQKLAGALFGHGARMESFLDHAVFASDPIFDPVLPAGLQAVSLSGSLTVEGGGLLFPSAAGQLELIADGDLSLYDDRAVPVSTLRMLDTNLDRTYFDATNGQMVDNSSRDDQLNLHRDDADPVRLYSLSGDIRNGYDAGGYALNGLTVEVPKAASVRAGGDIVNLDLRAQHYRDTDVTYVHAGRDYYNTPLLGGPTDQYATVRPSFVELGGPGLLDAQAGRHFGPIRSAMEPLAPGGQPQYADQTGLRTIGNRDNAGLPAQGADIGVRYGVGHGIATADFAGRYLDPSAADNESVWRQWLVDYMLGLENERRERAGETALASLDPQAAWQAFRELPRERQQPLVDRVFLDLLQRVGEDYNDPNSPHAGQYARGYRAIETLFPASWGYTANNLEGGANGAAERAATGTFDMRGSTVQTQRGGDIRILGPGGDLLVGSASAPPVITTANGSVVVGPNHQGILAIGEGDIGIFTDGNVALAQSRIFAQRGGDLTIWSSNGDINAGRGAKTSTEKPPVRYLCDQDHYCYVDLRGQVSGAGIATLQTVPGAPSGDAVLVAPRGTVDAGDAGIRVSGNLIVAAQAVANADNIQVQGDSIGVPRAARVDSGALSAASNAASGIGAAADELAQRRAPMATRDMPAIISVQVIGFGDCGADDPRCRPE